MRAIFSAVIAACKTAFGIGAAVLYWPLRLVFGFNGSSPREPIPEVAPPLEEVPEPPVDHTDLYRKTAIALQTWAGESLIEDERLPVPTTWPRSVQTWAAGLSRQECFAIIDVPEHVVIGHISEVLEMPRVRSLQPLQPVKWERAEPLDPARLSARFAASIGAVPEPS